MSQDQIDELGGRLQSALEKFRKSQKPEDEIQALNIRIERQSCQIDLLTSQGFRKDRKIARLENTVRDLRKGHGFTQVAEHKNTKLYAFRNANGKKLAEAVFGRRK